VINRIVRSRGRIGGLLFPSPTDQESPVRYELARSWYRKAERLAGIEHLPYRAFHNFRRRFATEMKHLRAVDVAALGGWKSTQTLKIYQQPELSRLYELHEQRREMRLTAGRETGDKSGDSFATPEQGSPSKFLSHLKESGAPRRNRTYNPRIKSPPPKKGSERA
jgi:hypothetical protein